MGPAIDQLVEMELYNIWKECPGFANFTASLEFVSSVLIRQFNLKIKIPL